MNDWEKLHNQQTLNNTQNLPKKKLNSESLGELPGGKKQCESRFSG